MLTLTSAFICNPIFTFFSPLSFLHESFIRPTRRSHMRTREQQGPIEHGSYSWAAKGCTLNCSREYRGRDVRGSTEFSSYADAREG